MENPQLFELIMKAAKIPSFTTFEDRMHSFVREFCESIGVTPEFIEGNNILIEASGAGEQPIALSAHLDKNNYWGDKGYTPPREIPVENRGELLCGLLDDAVGVGVCLHLLEQSRKRQFPPLQILLSECEESFGFRRKHLLNKKTKGLEPGIGARRLSAHLEKEKKIPAAVVVVDVTPIFDGESGIALYSRPWEKHSGGSTPELEKQTEAMAAQFHRICPRLENSNNKNDYVEFDKRLNQSDATVPCFALEPSVKHYHSCKEEVRTNDIAETAETLAQFLESFAAESRGGG